MMGFEDEWILRIEERTQNRRASSKPQERWVCRKCGERDNLVEDDHCVSCGDDRPFPLC